MKFNARVAIGVDLGRSRIRLAVCERRERRRIALVAVASRDIPDDTISDASINDPDVVATVLDDLRRETGVKRRDCVIALPATAAAVRIMRFPSMRPTERKRAAAFEGERIAFWNTTSVPSVTRAHSLDDGAGSVAVGVAQAQALHSRVDCMRRAKLRVIAVDHESCALQRALPFADAVLDVGHKRSTLHAFSDVGPLTVAIDVGGADVTRGISVDLAIDMHAAERRKRILGTAGAGEAARDRFVCDAAAAVEVMRRRVPIRRLALVGNAARLPGLVGPLEAAIGAIVEIPVSEVLRSDSYPDDVVRAAAPDWTLAAALAAWAL